MTAPSGRSVAVVGAGWAGLAAAVRATQAGHRVQLFEMAGQAGGRARSVAVGEHVLDNGQHILIGAYVRSLDLLRGVGADPDALLLRKALSLRDAAGRGLQLPRGPAWWATLVGLLRLDGVPFGERLSLLRAASSWALAGFQCAADLSVAQLCQRLPPSVRSLLIDPLCVAALNTPAAQASAQVFLRVLHDALLAGSGSSDLLLPRQPLGQLLAEPALAWLQQHGARIELQRRVSSLRAARAAWELDGSPVDAVILACPPGEAARLVEGLVMHPDTLAWTQAARALHYEPIVSVYLQAPGARLPAPMLVLRESAAAPAQFVFDHGLIRGQSGLLAAVISGASAWVERGAPATIAAVVEQLRSELGPWLGGAMLEPLRCLTEKRATFRCVPGLQRPAMWIADGLLAAGDYVDGPYPATLEGAVRAGEAAAAALG